jgi:chromosome segregation ATPase
MAHHMLDTPRTEAADRTRATLNLDFSEMPSFMPPPGADDLVRAMNSRAHGTNPIARHASLATPSARAPLAARRNPPARAEFTPLLQSAAKNRLLQRQQQEGKGVATPAALKAGYRMSSPALPEASVLLDSEIASMDQTPVALAESSIAMSTPIPMMPKRGELGLGGDGANLLTLREQEAVSCCSRWFHILIRGQKLEKIDKENFGLKLKIHFLEENLQRTGPEFSQQMLKENTDLKANGVLQDRDIKKYQKQIKYAEIEMEQYRLQLDEYIEKVKRRHMDEALRDELDKYKQLAEERLRELDELRATQGSQQNTANLNEVENLQEQVEDLEATVKDKEQIIDEKDDRIETLEAKLQEAEGAMDGELDKKDQQIETLEDEVHQLRAEVQKVQDERDDQDTRNGLQDRVEEVKELRSQVEAVQRAKEQQLHHFEARLEKFAVEKEAEIEDLRKRLDAEQEKQAEVEELQFRLNTALAQRDTQSQMKDEVANGLQERMELLSQEKDAKIARLQADAEAVEGMKSDMERVKTMYDEAAEACEALEGEKNELLIAMADKENTIKALQNAAGSHSDVTKDILRLRRDLEERSSKVSELQRIINTQNVRLDELSVAQYKLTQAEKDVEEKSKDIRTKQADVEVRDREIHTLRLTLDDRIEELEAFREAAHEPHSQVEGLQSIVRHRDEDLGELRSKANQQALKVEELQRLADERMRALERLRDEFADEKQQLEDDIQVLESSLDEAEDKVAALVNGMQATDDSQTKIEQLTRRLNAAEQKREMLEAELEDLQRDGAATDAERRTLTATVDRLRADLAAARRGGDQPSPLPKGTSNELRTLKAEQRTLQTKLDKAETTARDAARRHAAELQAAREAARAGGDAEEQVAKAGRRHEAEVRALAKQIQLLRARVARERLFRSELAFQKQWFLKMIGMYDQWYALLAPLPLSFTFFLDAN